MSDLPTANRRRWWLCVLLVALLWAPSSALGQGKVELDLTTYESLKAEAPGPATLAPEFVRADVQLVPAPSSLSDALAVDVRMTVVVKTYGPGQFVPLLPSDALVLGVATLQGAPLPISRGDEMFGARLSSEGLHTVLITLRTFAGRDGGAWLVEVPTPSAPVTKLSLNLDSPHVVMAGENTVSAVNMENERYIYAAAVGSGAHHSVRFRPAPSVTAGQSRLLATDATLLTVREGVVEGETRLELEVQGDPLEEITLELDGALVHLEVECDDVLTDAPVEGGRRLTMSRPTRASTLVVRYEVRTNQGQFRAPQIGVKGADRQHGAVAVEVWGGAAVSVEGEVRGARAIDEDELPSGFPGVPGERRFAWKYFGAAHDISLRSTQYERREVLQVAVRSAKATTVWTREGRGLTSLRLAVLNNADQFLRMRVPEGVTLWSAHVDDKGVHPVSDDGRVMIPLRKSRREGERLLPVSVALVLYHQGVELGPYAGGLTLELVSFELVVGSLEWELFLPEGNVWYGLEGWESPSGLDERWVGRKLEEIPDRFVRLAVEKPEASRRDELYKRLETRHRGALPVRMTVPNVGHRVAVRRHLVAAHQRSELTVRYTHVQALRGADLAVWLLTFLFFFSGFWLLWRTARERRIVWRTAWTGVGVVALLCVVGMLAALPLGVPGLAWPVGLGFATACAIAVSRTLWTVGKLAWDATIEAFGDDDGDGEYPE
jgi:hypothetical protein